MKRFFLVLVIGSVFGLSEAIQPVRKPFIQLTVDGNPVKIGDVVPVNPGQKLTVGAEMEGGRKDFCKFPDIYADIAGKAQILSRGSDGIVYQINGNKAEWKLVKKNIQFSGDEFIQVNADPQKFVADITISKNSFSQSFLKVSITEKWEFTFGTESKEEVDLAEASLSFKVAGSSDNWFTSHDILATGMRNGLVQEKLVAVQASCDTIEKNLNQLKFSAVPQSIKSLQLAINTLKTTIDEVQAGNPSYQTSVSFVGLPSDNSYNNLNILTHTKTHWALLEQLLQDLKQQLAALPATSAKNNNESLDRLIGNYSDWLAGLPVNALKVLHLYIPDLKPENILLPENIQLVAKEKSIDNFEQTLGNFSSFLDKRIEQIADENQKISSVQSKLQAVRLFDGMLRSYYSSINWAEWKNTRE